MGFLSGVLSNIHKHLGQHKNEINIAIEALNTNKHLGKKGFSVAIVKVVEGVGRYNDAVRNSNNHVKNKITDFDREMKRLKKTVSEDLKNNSAAGAGRIVQGSVDSADQLVETCLSNANKFNKSLDTAKHENVRNAINDCNSIVRDDVNKARACVKLETEQFAALSSKQQEDRKVMREKIERCLTDLGTCVNDSIKKKVAKLVEDLGLKVKEIKRQLVEIQGKLVEYIRELTTWIDKAQPLINSAFEKVKEILEDINDGNSVKKPSLIKSTVTQIEGAVAMLKGAGEDAGKVVKEKVSAALKQVKEMNDALKQDLYSVKQEIQKAIVNHVKKQIKTPYDELEGNVKQDLTTLKGNIKSEVNAIVLSSNEFSDQFTATQHAIDAAIQKVHNKVNNFKHLSNFNTFASDFDSSVPMRGIL
ncbi:hypothetical protein, conserved [Babesia bigemina]|uniref:Uncharacterized protein n=1 Tax=Babesia bigemina TaxID=5866 RepID=A0A061BJI8_BABBI|nr:hypothetical protein, conserved [Babesia bigemina]CDR71621.1 hypothetical protein, conserved [Babesia bigemina]|eukprot:XP_012770568.1 hypothetical protein, conserved [Babesia bigemina]